MTFRCKLEYEAAKAWPTCSLLCHLLPIVCPLGDRDPAGDVSRSPINPPSRRLETQTTDWTRMTAAR